jgi:hypothetical protein
VRASLDICALKRPFDDQTQPRIRLEADAVDLENEQNPIAWRAARVAEWLTAMPRAGAKTEELTGRTHELMALGLRNFDAFQLAGAEAAGAEVFR